MKTTMVIPTYWGRESDIGPREGDALYDHPTPADREGTLRRAIESLRILKDRDFDLVVLVVATAEDVEEKAERRVTSILRSASQKGLTLRLFCSSHLRNIKKILEGRRKEEYARLLEQRGYSNVRNLCLFVPYVLGAEVVILIDDDEVFEDPNFLSKAREFIGKTWEGRPVYAVAGFYLQPDGDFRLKKPFQPWMRYWDQIEKMNKAFEEFISQGPRLKVTPFVLGGNMVVHRDLLRLIPFDPQVTRGEDIDFLINAKMFGFDFFLDNQLSIKHLPPLKPHPVWKQMREDILRFLLEREKIRRQRDLPGMRKVTPEELDPYPGCFLREDLEEKVFRASEILALHYLSHGDRVGCKEAIKNMVIPYEAFGNVDPFHEFLEFKKKWEGLMEFVMRDEIRAQLKDILGREII